MLTEVLSFKYRYRSIYMFNKEYIFFINTPMSAAQYEKEVKQLEQETAAISSENATSSKSNSPGKTSDNFLIKYKSYIGMFIFAFILLYIIKPKYVLKIKIVKSGEESKAEIKTDIPKFILCWAITGVFLIGVHTMYASYYSKCSK